MTLLIALAAATFVGNDACMPCHAAIARSYALTGMARSTAAVGDNVPAGTFFHAPSQMEFTITNQGRVTIRRGNFTEQEKFDYVIGSGAAGFSYLVSRDRYLFQAPITWYSQKKRWDAAPGYQQDYYMAWDRQVDPSCLQCHASQLTHIYGTVNRYAERPFLQHGVACERCHGAGSAHVQGNGRMVAPSRLDAERRDDVCRQCHLMGEARIPRQGRQFGEFRAGERLGDYVAYFVWDDPQGPVLRTTSRVEKLNASRCKQVSGDRMWCGSCHDVHAKPVDSVAWYREKCLTCHATSDCNRGPNCAGCHMPKSTAVDAGHGAFTDHLIAKRPAPPRPPDASIWKLRPFSPADEGTREWALAYAQVYQRTRDERQKAEAVRLANSGRK